MKQPHTEQSIDHTDGQQNTGNHPAPGATKTPGGTRIGAKNVETDRDTREESVEIGTDVDKVTGLDEVNTSTKQVDNPRERHPERDEHGRL
ncbi:hypothetical protein [Acidisphaera sp. L21]|uniref:hypothetical protein n=1 Tax=Acidisphaera sp. L21 TaxID=1641851 RepID=UPI00131CEEAB|nr:hypothetical protein [Acidisphaera sp. L21]